MGTISTRDPFRDARLRVARAQCHADDFRRVSHEFFEGHRYTYAVEAHDDGAHDLLKVKFGEPLPSELPLLAAEVFWHLRSALDSTGYTIAVAVGARHPGDSHFPFGNDSDDPKRWRRSKALPKEIFSFMRKFKPYKGGHVGLWCLNDACNRCKHEMLILTPVNVGLSVFRVMEVAGGDAVVLDPPTWNSDKHELELVDMERGAKLYYDLDLHFDVSFDEPEPFAGEPAVGVLDQLVRETSRIIGAIEAESRRLKIIP